MQAVEPVIQQTRQTKPMQTLGALPQTRIAPTPEVSKPLVVQHVIKPAPTPEVAKPTEVKRTPAPTPEVAKPTEVKRTPTPTPEVTKPLVVQHVIKREQAREQKPTVVKSASPQVTPSVETRVQKERVVQREVQRSERRQAQGGESLGGFAAGMMLHQGFTALTGALATVPGKRREANYLGQVGGGAIAGATAGAMLGPAGALIGGAMGAATGAITAFAEEAKIARDALKDLRMQSRQQTLSIGQRRQDEAFERLLSGMNREQRDEAISERANQIRHGDGDASIRNLEAWLSKEAKAGRTDTEAYEQKRTLLSQQYARVEHLGRLDDKNYFLNLPKMLEQRDVTDSLQKMGGTVGPKVDVADANQRTIDLLRQLLEYTRVIASHATDSTGAMYAASGPFTTRLL
jgi:hypothetical protein